MNEVQLHRMLAEHSERAGYFVRRGYSRLAAQCAIEAAQQSFHSPVPLSDPPGNAAPSFRAKRKQVLAEISAAEQLAIEQYQQRAAVGGLVSFLAMIFVNAFLRWAARKVLEQLWSVDVYPSAAHDQTAGNAVPRYTRRE